MKKQLEVLTAWLLCAAILVGCVGTPSPPQEPRPAETQAPAERQEPAETEEAERRTIPFSQMEYVRPDLDGFIETVGEAAEEIEGGCEQSRAEELISLCYEEFEKFTTASKLALIRSNLDTRDEYYREEVNWCSENESAAQQTMTVLYNACAGMGLEETLGFEEDAFDVYDEGAMSDETVELMQREGELIAEYMEMTQNAVIELNGETVDYNSYMMTAEGADIDRATLEYYRQYNESAAEIYIELVKLRNAEAKLLGYDSFEEMMYGPEGFDRDYSPQDAEKLQEDIRKYISPLLNDDSGTIAYAGEGFTEIDSETLMNAFEPAVRSMGGSVEEAFDYMRQFALYDVGRRGTKADLGYVAYIDGYDAPYLFLQTHGDLSDTMELAHEFGHFTDGYVNYNAYETLELSEFFSQGMEYLMLGRLGDEIPQSQREAIIINKLMDTVYLYVVQGAYAEFEHRVYAADEDELTAEYLNELLLSITKEYGYYYEEIEELESLEWMQVSHFFMQPFYVISYPVSNDAAMQIFEMELSESGKGLEKYIELLQGSTAYLVESAEQAGLESPFAEGRMEKTAQTIRELIMTI